MAQGGLLDKLKLNRSYRKVVMSDIYIKQIEQIEPRISTRGRYTGSIWDPSRLVVVEHDAAVLNERVGIVPSIALMTNWEVDAEWHYADRGGLIMSLPDGYGKMERFEYEWEDWCLRHKFKPHFGHRDMHSPIEGRHVNIELLSGDVFRSMETPEQRLRSRLRYADLRWDKDSLTFSQALRQGVVYYSGHFGTLLTDEIIVFTATGTEAYRIHIGDRYDEADYTDWLYASE